MIPITANAEAQTNIVEPYEESAFGRLIAESLKFDDQIVVSYGSGKTTQLRFIAKDGNGKHIFQDISNNEFHQYAEKEAIFMLSYATRHQKGTSTEAEQRAAKLIETAYYFEVEGLFAGQPPQQPVDDISVVSAASDVVHNQSTEGTCYAHACATAIRGVEMRIFGRKPEPFETLVSAIISQYGTHGEHPATVLSHWCRKKHLSYQVVSGDDHGHATRALDNGRIIVASFYLSKYQWTLFSGFFKKYPARALSRVRL